MPCRARGVHCQGHELRGSEQEEQGLSRDTALGVSLEMGMGKWQWGEGEQD